MLDTPMRGRASVLWRDQSWADCNTLRDVIDVGTPAVVSVTEHVDFVDQEELHKLLPVAMSCGYIEYIIATAKWVDVESGACDLPALKRLAALANVSLCLISTHDTKLVNVKGAAVCWDYRCGTPLTVPYVKSPHGGHKLPLKGFIWVGPHGWTAQTKAVRAVGPSEVWHEFN